MKMSWGLPVSPPMPRVVPTFAVSSNVGSASEALPLRKEMLPPLGRLLSNLLALTARRVAYCRLAQGV